MKQPITLGINTTTRYISVALLVGDKEYIAEEYSERGHEGIILNLMDKVFAEAEISKRDVELLAFGRGPGAFTGIRVATALTQGLAVGLGLPVVPVSDLLNIAYQHHIKTGEENIAACFDARMKEVYAAVFQFSNTEGNYLQQEALLCPNKFICKEKDLIGVGNGFTEFPELVSQLELDEALSDFELVPIALATAVLGRKEYAKGNAVEAADALPVYLRNEVAWKP